MRKLLAVAVFFRVSNCAINKTSRRSSVYVFESWLFGHFDRNRSNPLERLFLDTVESAEDENILTEVGGGKIVFV